MTILKGFLPEPFFLFSNSLVYPVMDLISNN